MRISLFFTGSALPFNIMVLTIFLSLLVIGCNFEEIISPNHNKQFLQRNFTNPNEELFFDLENRSQILGDKYIEPRTFTVPEILIDVYNQTVSDNEVDSFVYSVAVRLGYPLWFESKIENSGDTMPEIIYVPLSHKDTNEISAYLIGWKDYSATNPELKLEIRLRSEIDSIRNGLKPFTSSACHEVLRFMMFDSIIYQRPTVYYDSLIIEGCMPTDAASFNSDPIIPRTCVSVIETMCMWVDDGNGWGEDTVGGYVDWQYDRETEIYIGQNLPPLNPSGGGGITISTIWFTWWPANPIKKRPIMAFHNPDEIKPRTLILVCSDFLVIRCLDGDWWEVVAAIPCSGCEVEEEEEKAMEAWCRLAALDLISSYSISGISDTRLAQMASNSCCDDFVLNPDCTILNYLTAKGNFVLDPEDDMLLNPCEDEWINENLACALKFRWNADAAFSFEGESTGEYGGGNHNGCGDAFRHAYWMALNTISCGAEKAEEFGIAHECDTPPIRNNEKAMDLHNNNIGIEVGLEYLNAEPGTYNVFDHLCARLENGDLFVLEPPYNQYSANIDSDMCECE